MKVAFYKGQGDWTDKLIRFWTGGIYSHCEIIIDDYWYTSSWYDGGVVKRKINPNLEHWDIYEINLPYNIKTKLENEVKSFYENTRGSKYDLTGILLNEIIPLNIQKTNMYYCSEWCCLAMNNKIKIENCSINPIMYYYILKSRNLI